MLSIVFKRHGTYQAQKGCTKRQVIHERCEPHALIVLISTGCGRLLVVAVAEAVVESAEGRCFVIVREREIGFAGDTWLRKGFGGVEIGAWGR